MIEASTEFNVDEPVHDLSKLCQEINIKTIVLYNSQLLRNFQIFLVSRIAPSTLFISLGLPDYVNLRRHVVEAKLRSTWLSVDNAWFSSIESVKRDSLFMPYKWSCSHLYQPHVALPHQHHIGCALLKVDFIPQRCGIRRSNWSQWPASSHLEQYARCVSPCFGQSCYTCTLARWMV